MLEIVYFMLCVSPYTQLSEVMLLFLRLSLHMDNNKIKMDSDLRCVLTRCDKIPVAKIKLVFYWFFMIPECSVWY